jgi:hypothetical protein
VTFAILCSAQVVAEEDWFESDQGYFVSVALGRFSDEAESKRFQFSSRLLWNSDFSFSYLDLELEQDREQSFSVRLQSDLESMVSFGLGYERLRSDSGFVFRDSELNSILSLGRIEAEVRVGRSDIQLGTEFEDPVLEATIADLGLLDITRERVGFSVGYFEHNWGIKVSLDDYESERSRSAEDFDLALILEGLDREQRQALFDYLSQRGTQRPLTELYRSVLLANYQYSQQLGVGADYILGFDMYVWDKKANTYSFGLAHVERIGNEEQSLHSYVSGEFPLRQGLSLGLMFAAEERDSSTYSELSIGYSW